VSTVPARRPHLLDPDDDAGWSRPLKLPHSPRRRSNGPGARGARQYNLEASRKPRRRAAGGHLISQLRVYRYNRRSGREHLAPAWCTRLRPDVVDVSPSPPATEHGWPVLDTSETGLHLRGSCRPVRILKPWPAGVRRRCGRWPPLSPTGSPVQPGWTVVAPTGDRPLGRHRPTSLWGAAVFPWLMLAAHRRRAVRLYRAP